MMEIFDLQTTQAAATGLTLNPVDLFAMAAVLAVGISAKIRITPHRT